MQAPSSTNEPLSLRARARRGAVALLAGAMIDAADLATSGALIGGFALPVGLLLGGGVGAWLAPHFGCADAPRWRLGLGVLAGLYCAIPTTELLPLAAILGATGRFGAEPDPSAGSTGIEESLDEAPPGASRRATSPAAVEPADPR